MARARNIKPAIMDNEELAELPPLTRLLFIYLWMLADREGRLEDRPKRIAAQALPYDRSADAEVMLSELEKAGFITRYEAAGARIIQVLNFAKHQAPHIREAASELPEQAQGTTKEVTEHNLGSAQASPRSPDSLIPDSLIPDCPLLIADTPTLIVEGCDEASPSTRRRKPAQGQPSATGEAWDAYSTAYMTRYTVGPVRNAKVNGQMAQFVSRVGAGEAPHIAAWFVGHQNGFYVRNMHSVDSLLRDAEKLRTEWATNRRMTNTQAQLADRTETNRGAFQHLIEKAKAQEAVNGER